MTRVRPGCLESHGTFNRRCSGVIGRGPTPDVMETETEEARLYVLKSDWIMRRTKSVVTDELPTKGEPKYIATTVNDMNTLL